MTEERGGRRDGEDGQEQIDAARAASVRPSGADAPVPPFAAESALQSADPTCGKHVAQTAETMPQNAAAPRVVADLDPPGAGGGAAAAATSRAGGEPSRLGETAEGASAEVIAAAAADIAAAETAVQALTRRGRRGGDPRAGFGRRLWRASFLPLLFLLGVFVALSLTGWALSGRPVGLPVWLVAEAQSRLNRALEGKALISLGDIEVNFSASRAPEVRLIDLRLSPPEGGGSVLLPEAVARFEGWALLRGQIQPKSVQIIGPQIALRRLPDGRFNFGLDAPAEKPPETLAEVLLRVDQFFQLPALRTLERIDAEAITVTLEDLRAKQIWTMGDGRTSLSRQEGETVLTFGAGLVGGGSTAARAQMTFRMRPGGEGVKLEARVDGIAARDIAQQSPLLALLGVLDAPISGDLRADLDAAGTVQQFEGSLTVGQGALSPAPGARALPLNRAEVAFGFDPASARITATHLVIESPELRLRARAHVDLQGVTPGRIPEAFLVQLRFDDVQVDPAGMFVEPVRFSEGALDMRLRLDPFSVEVGQLALVEEGRHVLAKGEVAAGTAGWTVALDLALDTIAHDRLIALWPVGVVPRTREWLVNNVQQGTLFDVKAGLRLRPGQEPRLSLGYEFKGADVRFMKTLPPIQNGRGYAMIEGQTYTTVVEDGHVTPPEGGEIRVTRSVFRVPDITQRPPPAEITLQTESAITAALSLLDQPPFGFLGKAGLSPDLGEGRAQLTTSLRLPLAPRVRVADVLFEVTGELTQIRSERLVKGRVLEAERLQFSATPERVEVSGPGRIGSAHFDARWTLPIGPGQSGSRARGSLRLDEGFAKEFLQALPPGTLQGHGQAQLDLEIPKGAAPRLKLSSDLAGVSLRINEIGWTKPAGARGKLEVEGQLGQPPRLDRLVLEGSGLAAEGRLSLTPEGQLERLSLSRIALGDWLDGKVELEGRGRGQPPAVRLQGGTLDIRRLPEARAAGAASGQPAPVDVALDRVILSGGMALHDLRGRLEQRPGGLDGGFTARLNGGAPVVGQLVAGPRGMGVRLQAEDGGATLASAGIFGKARGGKLDLVLNPTGAKGVYEGDVQLGSFTVRDLPALAELLSAASIIGLIEQISTSGVVFSEARGRFLLTPGGIEIREGSAVGASFGVSLEGVYLTGQDHLDLQGVISPFYLINSIGSVLTRPGEGVMGFTYRIKGSASAPVVSVNPLSVLAPSFFRDLLRRPAARLETPRQE